VSKIIVDKQRGKFSERKVKENLEFTNQNFSKNNLVSKIFSPPPLQNTNSNGHHNVKTTLKYKNLS